jgi:hypothetical protein
MTKCVRKITYMDVQWSDCPLEVKEVVKLMWRRNELGNDHYIINTSIEGLLEDIDEANDYPEYHSVSVYKNGAHVNTLIPYITLVEYLRDQGVTEDEEVIIHWWW